MSPADHLSIAGIVVTGAGSTIAMAGVCFQVNGYFAFKARDFSGQLFRVLRAWLFKGGDSARRQLVVAAKLAEERGEDRVRSLIGFYCVLLGFLFQMLGSALLFAALFAGGGLGHARP
jgi:hypothetical protein